MADDRRFFENVLFPRFTLKLPHKIGCANTIDHMARLFVGLQGSEGVSQWSNQTASQLMQILTKLAPLVEADSPSVSRPVELALRFDMRQTDEARMNVVIEAIHAHRHQPFARERDCSSESDAINILVSQPHIVDCLVIGNQMGANTAWHLTCGRQLRTPLATRVIDSALAEDQEDRANFRDFARSALRVRTVGDSTVSAGGGGVRHLQFLHEAECCGVPALCSALPHTQSLQTFQIAANTPYQYGIDTDIVIWLGYALFHPDSASSSWRKLFFNNLHYRRNEWDVYGPNDALDMMAKGNNLLVTLGLADSDKLTNAYYTATIRAGAVIRDEPRDDDEVTVDILAVQTQMDVCVTTTDVSQLNE